MVKKSKDYHDYVFKEGRLIGNFEDMYKNSDDVPWHQDIVPDTWSGRIGIDVIEAAFEMGDIKTVLEVGCGYGYTFSKIKRQGVEFNGFDISKTAIKKASQLNPEHNFFVDDIKLLKLKNSYDLVICKEILWYVIYDLDIVLYNIKRLVKPSGYLYIALSFPRLTKSFVGKEILSEPNDLLSLLEKDFNPLVVNLLHKCSVSEDGPNLHWLGKKR